jgi:hypothetical protein
VKHIASCSKWPVVWWVVAATTGVCFGSHPPWLPACCKHHTFGRFRERLTSLPSPAINPGVQTIYPVPSNCLVSLFFFFLHVRLRSLTGYSTPNEASHVNINLQFHPGSK